MWSTIRNASVQGKYQILIQADALEEKYCISSKGKDLKIVSEEPLPQKVKVNAINLYDFNKQNLNESIKKWLKESKIISISFVDQKV